jgi:hypothetical protein
MREVRRPLRHERSLPLAAKSNKGKDARALGFVVLDLRPGVVEEQGIGFAADELRGGVFDDAGDVDGDRAGRRFRRYGAVVDVVALNNQLRNLIGVSPFQIDAPIAAVNSEV